jgi:hypothetical protein
MLLEGFLRSLLPRCNVLLRAAADLGMEAVGG